MSELDSYLVSDEAARQTESAAGRMLTPGAAIGAFRVVAFLGRGATSEVYRVRDDALKADFALKIFALDERHDKERERFLAEARLLAQLQSPHVVRVHSLSDVGVHPYFTMDLLRPPPDAPSRRQAEQIISGVLDALEELHSKGIIHRDIKPSNILLDGNGLVVVTDLGIAHVSGDASHNISATMPRNMTIADGKAVAIGTPGYSAPEQFFCGEVSPAADIHAVGVLAQHLFGSHAPLKYRWLILRMTSSLPGLRYPSVKSARKALRRLRVIELAIWTMATAIVIALSACIAWAVKTGMQAKPQTQPLHGSSRWEIRHKATLEWPPQRNAYSKRLEEGLNGRTDKHKSDDMQTPPQKLSVCYTNDAGHIMTIAAEEIPCTEKLPYESHSIDVDYDENGYGRAIVERITLRNGKCYEMPKNDYPQWLSLQPGYKWERQNGRRQLIPCRSHVEIKGNGILKYPIITGVKVKICSGVTLITSGICKPDGKWRKTAQPPLDAQMNDTNYVGYAAYTIEPGGKLVFTDISAYPTGLIEAYKQ